MVVMQQVGIAGTAIETELHHRHPRQPEPLPELFDVVADDAEVLGHQRQVRKPVEAGLQKMIGRTWHPISVSRRWRLGRNLPVRLKTPKVINPDQIEKLTLTFQPFQPPPITVFRHNLPIVERVSPVLSIGGK